MSNSEPETIQAAAPAYNRVALLEKWRPATWLENAKPLIWPLKVLEGRLLCSVL